VDTVNLSLRLLSKRHVLNRISTRSSAQIFTVQILLLISATGLLPHSDLHAQTRVVAGVVKDNNTYREISGVNIYLRDGSAGTATGPDGRYRMRIDDATDEAIVVFRHVSYDSLEIRLDSLQRLRTVYMQAGIIPMEAAEITGTSTARPTIVRDLPQTMSILDSKQFEDRGYVDAGDLLRTDHSIQVDENVSGQKLLSIRGGNADEVIVLYDGIKLNSSFDNLFDFSLIDPSDIERFEIIKGGNTSLYGPDALAGVVNIVPRKRRDYSLRLHQQIGSYDSGTWGLQAHGDYGRVFGSYSLRNGGMTRSFLDAEELKLTNVSWHHSAGASWDLSSENESRSISGLWRYSTLDYTNERDSETLKDLNNVLGIRYEGSIGSVSDMLISLSMSNLKHDAVLSGRNSSLEREIDDRTFHFNVRKGSTIGDLELLLAYQLESSDLGFTDRQENVSQQVLKLESSDFTREHHGVVAIAKLHGETGSEFLQTFDVDLSLRRDVIDDTQKNPVYTGTTQVQTADKSHSWDETLYKFAVSLTGIRENLYLRFFLNYGKNARFPTLFQQISSPLVVTGSTGDTEGVLPEKNSTIEIGFEITGESAEGQSISGWQFTADYFENIYKDKFRTISTPGIPFAFYDNVKTAQISGLEGTARVYLLRKKITLDLGLSKYFISDQSAFPFKSDFKRTLAASLDHAGFSVQLLWFYESEQTGLLRQLNGGYTEVELPEFENLDIHAGRVFPVGKVKLFANASVRNILNQETVELSGLALRDRRYYITVGIQY